MFSIGNRPQGWMLAVSILALSSLVSCAHNSLNSNSSGGAGTNETLQGAPGNSTANSSAQGATGGSSETIAEKGDLDSVENGNIPEEINEAVLKWVGYFQGRGRKFMEKYLERSARYSPVMVDILKKNGLPEDLIYLCLIESGFSGTARSHAGAAGYWQFIRGTGKVYGLKINQYMDERRDPVRSTEAASAYLKGLYNLFGSWYLAIASYNVGENRVKRSVMNNYTRDFWELARKKVLPRETIDYVPKYIAARMIAKDPAKYGFDQLEYLPPFRFDEISVESAVSLRKLAQSLGMTYEEMKELNPSFKGEIATTGTGGVTKLRVPEGKLEMAKNEISNSFVSSKRFVVQDDLNRGMTQHKIAHGETLAAIARKYRVSLASLRSVNDLGRKAMIRTGGTLQIPTRGVSSNSGSSSNNSTGNSNSKKNKPGGAQKVESQGIHVVRRGDTLFEISRRYRVPLRQLASANGMRVSTRVQAGRRLIIPD